jgi:hypothetical protein
MTLHGFRSHQFPPLEIRENLSRGNLAQGTGLTRRRTLRWILLRDNLLLLGQVLCPGNKVGGWRSLEYYPPYLTILCP